jgi:hypothetical protein
MALKLKKIKSKYLSQRQKSRENFYNSAIHKQSISQNCHLFYQHLQADIEFAVNAPFYNPMDEIDLIPFIIFLFQQFFTLIALFYLAFVYSALALIFNFLFHFNLTELNHNFNVFINASLCLLMVFFDMIVHISLLALSPITRTLATFFPVKEESEPPLRIITS